MRFSVEFKPDSPELDQAFDESKEKAKRTVFNVASRAKALTVEKAPSDTSHLKKMIHMVPDVFGFFRYTVSDGTAYGRYVNDGTRPHKVSPFHLKDWARRVLGDENLAFAVAKSIEKHGTKRNPFFTNSFHQVSTTEFSGIARDSFDE